MRGYSLALRLKAKPGSALAIGRNPEIADKTSAGRGRGQSLGGLHHFGKRSFDRMKQSQIYRKLFFSVGSPSGITLR